VANRIWTGILLVVGLMQPIQAQRQTVGLFVNDAPDPGYTLFSPIGTENSYLISNDGLLVRSWTGTSRPGLMAYLTPAGTLLRSTKIAPLPFQAAAGSGGRLEEYDWDGNLVWEYEYSSSQHLQHHDIELLANGNVLIVAWDLMTSADAIAAGKNPANVPNDLLIDSVIEVQPSPPVGGTIVWEWHASDHLIQDFDPTKNNFGVVADHPELIDFNFNGARDWSHVNSVAYNAALDQIVISVLRFDEIWVIDHSTTTAEAAGHSGGNSGRGGDLIYRWGNPQAYGRGGPSDQELFGQHDAQWIEPGLQGAGNFLVFNNNQAGPSEFFSTVDEFVPPVDANGNYVLVAGQAYGPAGPVWTYQANPPESFHSSNTSGAIRLPNGNTLITGGFMGQIFEVDPAGTVTWEYQNPDTGPGLLNQGDPVSNSGVFKARRYPPGFPGFSGRDLTPGDPVENFSRPLPPGSQSLRVDKTSSGETQLDLTWSDDACPSFEYHVLFGDLANVATVSIDGGVCDIGPSGSSSWSDLPAGSLFFVVVGTDITGVYESTWGNASDGLPRGGTKASFRCSTTTKVLDPQCP